MTTRLLIAAVTGPFLDPTTYGAQCDMRGVYDAVVDVGDLSEVVSATAVFTADDTGRTYTLASTAGAVTTGTLTFVDATHATMSTAAGGAMTGARLIFGTDDHDAWQNALDAAKPGQAVDCADPMYRSLVASGLDVPVGVHLGLQGRGPFDPQTNPCWNDWGPTIGFIGESGAFLTLTYGAGVGDLILYCINQVPPTAATPTAFGPVITMTNGGVAGCRIGSPYIPNAYIGIYLKGGRHIVDCPQIGALANGIRIDYSADYLHIRTVTCSPYWRVCEGMAYTPTAGSLDEYALDTSWAVYVERADAFHIGEIASYGLFGGLLLTDSDLEDGAQSQTASYGIVGMIDADLAAYGVNAIATQGQGVIISALHNAGNPTGVGTAGQYGAITAVGGSSPPAVVIKSWSLWGTHVGNSLNGAGTLIVPATNPG